ncbi:MAG: flavodoxin [Alkalispirochaeta sp.]|jgi:flavodoxin I
MIAVIYGSSTLNTEYSAQRIQAAFGAEKADIHNVKHLEVDLLRQRDNLVFVSSTWGTGDLQDDWEVFFPHLDTVDFRDKTVGLVGLGDQENYPDTFCDGISLLYDKVLELGGRIVGETSTEGYSFTRSNAVRNGKFVGLILDEDSQADRSAERIDTWVRRYLKETVSYAALRHPK